MEPFQFSKWPILTEWLPALFHSTLFPFSQARLSHNLTTQYLKVYATKYTFRYIHPLFFYVPINKLILGFAIFQGLQGFLLAANALMNSPLHYLETRILSISHFTINSEKPICPRMVWQKYHTTCLDER